MSIMQDNVALDRPAMAEESESSSREAFSYSKLDTSRDGMRLVVLEPATEPDAVVRCRLEHVTFGEMPKYEALSYTWGDDFADRTIEVNGKTFLVRENLWKALIRLRILDRERFLWIDAVCINQDDILERNQQVRIMPHIYSRAQTVLAWLGSTDEPGEDSRVLYRKMCRTDYWRRVWIVQEIGKARRIKVHYGSKTVDWEPFINVIKGDSKLTHCIPLKLANQMRNKYGDGYKLENLLMTHRNSLCKDARDKIYGFTGLANDTYGRLEMDYGKTPFRVWEDVVSFRNADKTVSQYDIIQFAQFVRGLLGGLGASPEREIKDKDMQKYKYSIFKTVLCPAVLWGKISCVGPSIDEMRSNLLKVDQWRESISRHVSHGHLSKAREESDLILELLEDIDPSDFRVRYVEGQFNRTLRQDWGRRCTNIFNNKSEVLHSGHLDCAFNHKPAPPFFKGDSIEKSFVLVDIYPTGSIFDKMEKDLKLTPGFALAPSYAEEGDFICYFYCQSTAALVRPNDEYFSVIGTAVVPDVHIMAKQKRRVGKAKPNFVTLDDELFKEGKLTNVRLNLETLFQWLE